MWTKDIMSGAQEGLPIATSLCQTQQVYSVYVETQQMYKVHTPVY